MKKDLKIEFDVVMKVKCSWRDALKLRLAGAKIVKDHVESQLKEKGLFNPQSIGPIVYPKGSFRNGMRACTRISYDSGCLGSADSCPGCPDIPIPARPFNPDSKGHVWSFGPVGTTESVCVRCGDISDAGGPSPRDICPGKKEG